MSKTEYCLHSAYLRSHCDETDSWPIVVLHSFFCAGVAFLWSKQRPTKSATVRTRRPATEGTAATKRLFNPILLVKLVIVAVAVPIMWRMQKKVFDDPLISENVVPPGAKAIAASQTIMWLIVMTACRLIAYSATIFGDGY